MNRIYLTTEGETIGLGTQSLRKHFNATIPDPPKPSDLAFLNVVCADVPPEPKSIDTTYTLSATVIDGVAVAKWVGTPRSSKDTQQRREEWNTQSVIQVKAEASKRILDRMPDFKQRNYIAFNLEMERKERKGEVLTPTELATIAFTEGEWEFAKAIRSASNQIESEVALLTDAEAGVFDVSNHPLWVV